MHRRRKVPSIFSVSGRLEHAPTTVRFASTWRVTAVSLVFARVLEESLQVVESAAKISRCPHFTARGLLALYPWLQLLFRKQSIVLAGSIEDYTDSMLFLLLLLLL